MIAPGALVRLFFLSDLKVMGTPLVVGLFFGPKAVAGLLPGALISGV